MKKEMLQPFSFLSEFKDYSTTVLLIDDQAIIAEAIRRLLKDEKDITFHYCENPEKAIEVACDIFPTVILQDLVMPDVDGLSLLRYFRLNPKTKSIPMIVLSTKEEPKIKAEAFALGANDYVVKLPDKEELVARIRYHSNGYIRLLERNEAYEKLRESQEILNAELVEAASYIKSLLPPAIDGKVKTSWQFIPSMQLGGDIFDYYWIDSDHFVTYLLDVCGHGIGAALLSISLANVLRTHTISGADFYDPSSVLEALNEAFPMERHNRMFFTIWYGVYNAKKRQLVYASGGHPPAVLLVGTTSRSVQAIELTTEGVVVGGMQGVKFRKDSCKLEAFNKLYVFSDGVYELPKADGTVMSFGEFLEMLKQPSSKEKDVDRILRLAQEHMGSSHFPDDFSLVELTFR